MNCVAHKINDNCQKWQQTARSYTDESIRSLSHSDWILVLFYIYLNNRRLIAEKNTQLFTYSAEN